MALKQENRWEARPRTAAFLKICIYLVPFIASAFAARASQTALRTAYPEMHWSVAAVLSIPLAAIVLVVLGRVMRRLLPLALLLRLSLLFPDQIPDRLGVALRAASTKRLVQRMSEDSGERANAAENILALVAALGAHDRRTRGHSERVRALTMLMADEIGLKPEDRDRLEWAALLHDLGKLEVPGEILNKNGRPTDHEWAVLREHPSHGPAKAGALGDWLGEWIHAMDQHHERFDGTGYPQGLSSEDIALSGRIVAVSDAFEVMTATRSYKKPMTTQAARDELVSCAGTHFDPAIVRAFMAISIGDIHRVLGPTSWLASIPYIGSVTNGIGATTSAAMLGGSISPAIATALALVLMSPTAEPARGPDQPVLAFAETETEAPESDSSDIVVSPDSGDELLAAVRHNPRSSIDRVIVEYPADIMAKFETTETTVDAAPTTTPEPEDEHDPGDGADPGLDVDLPSSLDPLVDNVVGDVVDDVLQTVEVLSGDLLADVGLDEVVEPLVGETLDIVDDVTNGVVEQTGLEAPLEQVGEVLSPLTSGDSAQSAEEVVSEVLDLGGLFGR